ncbi:MAG TPA: diaminopimelate decarboxylase [Cyclobacteriaceae bacterium]|nr:diaminopimelate decarboxylase [Cyclobacteriaceae bacterium]
MKLESGKYSIQGLAIDGICKQFGTPLYLYDAGKITSQVDNLRKAFDGAELKIKYAMKALTNISILKLLGKQGVGVDAVSINEAKLAIRAGIQAADINFTPSGVDFSEIKEGVALGLNVNLDNLPILEKFGKEYGSKYPCGIRLNPHIMAGGNIKISTGHVNSKFGISIQQLDQIKAIITKYNIVLQGLHIHTGSEIIETDVFMQMSDIFFGMAKDFKGLKFIDFGGGFKVAYKKDDKITDLPAIGSRLSEKFKAFEKETGRHLQLWIEPGKYLVSEAGYLVATTNVVKETPTLTFAGVDTGLNHLVRPMMYNSYHEIVNISNPGGPVKTYTIVGNICETDTLGSDRELNEVREGDLLVLKNAGAYGYSMASNYNSRFRPAEVLVIDGKALLIRERDTLEDILRGQKDVID